MTTWRLGTMGFAYEAWRGVFYPETANPRQYLAPYSQVFDAVELDSTFYGAPRESTVRQWAAQTPPGFRFCPKTPRDITHERGLALARGAGEAMLAFLDAIRLFGDKLGPVLIQLPPSFDPVQRPALAEFLAMLPHDVRYAVELRHRGWVTPETAAFLREHGAAALQPGGALDVIDAEVIDDDT
jgi:uncharacterized protein YecE (DUF72 family)